MKTGGDAKPISKKKEDHSVKTGRTMEQIAEACDAEWESGREADESPSSQFKARVRAAIKKKSKDAAVGQAHRMPAAKRGHRTARSEMTSLTNVPSDKPSY